MFFDKMNGGAGMGPGMGMSGGAAGLTSPGMNPQSLAALMAMFGGGGVGGGMGGPMMAGPQLPALPARGGMGGPAMPQIPPVPGPQAAPAAAMPAMPAAAQPNLMDMLTKMDPAKLQDLMAKLGLGTPQSAPPMGDWSARPNPGLLSGLFGGGGGGGY
jgi:hypothetical protein